MNTIPLHKFHIPVMGLAFTIDSPIKVARYGITSAISIVEDNLIEVMRKFYYKQNDEPFVPISTKVEDYRAKRITDYLNLMNRIINKQIEKLQKSAFQAGSDIVKYYEMLPDSHSLKQLYHTMCCEGSEKKKIALEDMLRKAVKPGEIEVNIMTKIDKNNYDKDGNVLEDGSDALSALRGYANSVLQNSSIIFSAGMNPRLFNYLEKFDSFDATAWGKFKRKVIIKVSDYRSALIQGKYLAKKGIWTSEFRLESGLNCGGHTFATDGLLMGPILEEFKHKKDELMATLHELYCKALKVKEKPVYAEPHPIKITAQGGIGTYEEAALLHQQYGVASTGWGTPFLLCPEATTVDEDTLGLLSEAIEKDVVSSKNSPLGVRFSYLKGTSGEKEKLERIDLGNPGSPCTEKHLISNSEFTTEPICTASKKYQKLKIAQLRSARLTEEEYKIQAEEVLAKECLCIGLSNAAPVKYEQPFLKNLRAVTICPGPNIAYFSKVVSLKEMADHIYGRTSIIDRKDRPHMFIKELQLYIEYIKEQISENTAPDSKFIKYCIAFTDNLFKGIAYYRELFRSGEVALEKSFEQSLTEAERFLQQLCEPYLLSSANQEA